MLYTETYFVSPELLLIDQVLQYSSAIDDTARVSAQPVSSSRNARNDAPEYHQLDVVVAEDPYHEHKSYLQPGSKYVYAMI